MRRSHVSTSHSALLLQFSAVSYLDHLLQIGVMFGNPETTSGGNALKYYATMRLDIRAKDKIMETGKAEPVGNKVKVKVVKNKVKSMEYDSGVSCSLSLIDLCVIMQAMQAARKKTRDMGISHHLETHCSTASSTMLIGLEVDVKTAVGNKPAAQRKHSSKVNAHAFGIARGVSTHCS